MVKKQIAMKRIKTKSGLDGYECRLQESYSSFKYYCEIFSLHSKIGFKTPQEAWEANPVIQGSTNPSDFQIKQK